jgi:hypothetical protein
MSNAVATTLANFNRESKALPIAPVPTKPIFSISVYLPRILPFVPILVVTTQRPRSLRIWPAEPREHEAKVWKNVCVLCESQRR